MDDGIRIAIADEVERRAWNYAFLGVACLVVGFLSLGYAWLTTLTSVFVFGAALVVWGVVHCVQAVQGRDASGAFVQLPFGILEVVTGVLLVTRPGVSLLALTLVLSAFFIVSGIFRIAVAATLRFRNWGWPVASGLITLLLGLLVWAEWPLSSLWLLGTFVSVYLIATGSSYLALGLVARSLRGRGLEPAVQP